MRQHITRLLLLTLAYFTAGWFGLKLPFIGTHITLVWLPTGIAVAALLRWGWTIWPGITLGAFLVTLSVGSPWYLAVAIAAGNTLGPILSGAWLKHAGFHQALDRQKDVGALVVAAAAGMTVSASVGVASLSLAGMLPWDAAGFAILSWWLGDTIGVLLAAPFLLTLSRENLNRLNRAGTELFCWVLASTFITWFVLLYDYQEIGHSLPLAFLTLPLVTWAGLRFGNTGAALAGLGFSVFAAWGTAIGHGGFILPDVRSSLLLLWVYMATTSLTGLLIAVLQAERLAVEKDLRASTDSLKDAQRIANVGSWRLDLSNDELSWSDEMFRLLEIDPSQASASYQAFFDAVHPADRDAVHQAYAETLNSRTPFDMAYRLLTHDGRIKWLHARGKIDFDADGKALRSQGTVQDISERRLIEESLRKLSLAVQQSPSLIVITDLDAHIEFANEAFYRTTGYSPAETIGKNPKFLKSGKTPAATYVDMWSTLSQGKSWSGEFVNRRKDGSEYIEFALISPVQQADQRITHYLAIKEDITERKHAESALRESHQKMYSLLNSMAEGAYGVDTEGNCTFVNRAFLRILGYDTADEVIGKPIHELIHHSYPDGSHYPDEECRMYAAFRYQQEVHVADEVFWRKDGTALSVEYWSQQIVTDGVTTGAIATFIDISERKQAEHQLRIAATVFEAQEGMEVTDAGKNILRVNKAFTDITGYSADEVIGKNPRLFQSGRHPQDFYSAMWETIAATGSWEGEVWNRRKNGEIYLDYLTISAVKDQHGIVTHYVGTHMDITLKKAAAEEIEHLAFYDPLTKLPNRRLLQDRLKTALATSHRNGRKGALFFIDLDNFKTLNDTLGHDMGDLLLQQVAERLSAGVRTCDTVARLGGDEFVIMLQELSEQSLAAAQQAEHIGSKLLATLNQPYQLATHNYVSTPSIGVTLFSGHDRPPEELFKQADIAMYQAKTSGRNALRFFDPQMQGIISDRFLLEDELRKALDNRQFELHYQLQVDSAGRPLGAEALIRWSHPVRGLMTPKEFIPLAEETGAILSIGQWVLKAACAQLKAWQQQPASRDLTLSVNVSAKQFFQADFVTQVQAVIEDQAINPMLLKLELTESLLLKNIEEAIAIMNALGKIGVRFSLDDFGTGYSSLQYIKKLPLHQLKIDRLFIRDIADDSSDQAIVRTIIAMAESLGLNVIAEGVESEEQRQFLLNNGCINFQGYLFGRPTPIAQFEALLKR